MGRTCVSLSIIFGVVPDATRAWKPEMAPHMMQMKTKGKMPPQGKVGPPFSKAVMTGGARSTGLTTNRAMGIVQAMVNVPHILPGTSCAHFAGRVSTCGSPNENWVTDSDEAGEAARVPGKSLAGWYASRGSATLNFSARGMAAEAPG